LANAPITAPARGEAVPQPLIGSFLLESITTGMYGERRNAIREYVQNSLDGVQAAVAAKTLKAGSEKITLTIDAAKNSLTIYDNGIGLPYRVAVSTLTTVGASKKQRGRDAGFRGIGRLAGIAFSNTLQFRAKAAGDEVETIVSFDCVALRKGMEFSGLKPAALLISECVTWQQRKALKPSDHYFEVTLQDLTNAPLEATRLPDLEGFLAQVAPVDFHPDFASFKSKIFAKAGAIQVPVHGSKPDDDDPEMEPLLDRIGFDHVSIVLREAGSNNERPVYKPYRPRMLADKKAENELVPLTDVSVRNGAKGTWWGWIGHKKIPGDYQQENVAGIRIRLKNIQIDGNDLIRDLPTSNEARSTFGRWSNWFVGEIYFDPRSVVPNARRDNFEETDVWLKIREEITPICVALTKEARTVSDEYQVSLKVLEKKVKKHRETFLKATHAKTIDLSKIRKLIVDTEKIEKDLEKAGPGETSADQLKLKTFSKELNQIRVSLLEKPKTHDYEQFRKAIRQEMLDATLKVLGDYLELSLYEEVKKALEKALR
jgi:Histidine kinase-, DNA gyrase B-, and HSP90-like ATPase